MLIYRSTVLDEKVHYFNFYFLVYVYKIYEKVFDIIIHLLSKENIFFIYGHIFDALKMISILVMNVSMSFILKWTLQFHTSQCIQIKLNTICTGYYQNRSPVFHPLLKI
ncbi:hypothetical protein HHI36_000214 [Cryptolaemus montrouzieri]|uniref:Uncharacterized protein n=1 Tax=Cryptolaemus montrouzieri TaxID=559131 RepID=A0ABD2P3Z2_9CUCU